MTKLHRHGSGMQGVYLVAAELSGRGFIASLTNRSERAADLLVTNQGCTAAFSVQVKTNQGSADFWLLSPQARALRAPSHAYVFVNLTRAGPVFYVAGSVTVADRIRAHGHKDGAWYSFKRDERLRDNWGVFGAAADVRGPAAKGSRA
ncbi:MAG: hypothetical protein IT437_04285 [Phycisphaerales bacterium]|nr:hypothetical protein [Phycisphaerales bacterium]